MLIKITVIRPAQTESSKTAASGEASLNMIMESTALVKARPMDARIMLPRITDQRENNVINNSSIKYSFIVYKN